MDVISSRLGPHSSGDRWPRDPWATLSREIQQCTKCPLHRTRSHAVIYRGSRHPFVVFIGEAPGAAEDASGVPFVGRAGKALDRAIEDLGLSLEEVGVLNVIKCRPPANRFDPRAAIKCRPFLERQIELLQPRLLVPLGARALETLDPKASPITQAAGRPRIVGARELFPLLHPAATFRSRRYARRWARDLGGLRHELANLGTKTLYPQTR